MRIDLEYDGTDFVGWQEQAQGRTVQGELQRALRSLLQEEVTPVGSGRTDAGTHARGQVAHIQTATALPLDKVLRGLNALLPDDIAARRVITVPDAFHARYSARGKRYRYRVSTIRPALERQRVWPIYAPLDTEPMVVAARRLLGTHDFRAFCKADPEPDHYTCHIDEAEWRQQGPELVFDIEGNRFLRHMVRILVGTFVDIGRGRLSDVDFAALLQSDGQRQQAGQTAPSTGLCLLKVRYDDDDGGNSG